MYFVNKKFFYAWMAFTKQLFGLIAITITHWFSPTIIRLSGEAAIADQMRISQGGTLETTFPNRLVLMANHQVCFSHLHADQLRRLTGCTDL